MSGPLRTVATTSYYDPELLDKFNEDGGDLRRVKSSAYLEGMENGAGLAQLNRNLEKQIRVLQKELYDLKRKVQELDTESSRWGIRYSKRMVILSNLLLGIYSFWSRYLHYVRNRYRLRGLIRQMLFVPKFLQNSDNSKQLLMYEGFVNAAFRSILFFFSTYLLTRKVTWVRNLGFVTSTAYSLYLAFFSRFMPWTNYFNIFANVLYITARLNYSSTLIPSLTEFIAKSDDFIEENNDPNTINTNNTNNSNNNNNNSINNNNNNNIAHNVSFSTSNFTEAANWKR